MKSTKMLPYSRRLLTLLFSVGLSTWSFSASPEEAFRNPSDTAKPGVWWHWMGSNVSKEGITQDLEEFKKAGISGATIFGMADVSTPWAGHIENSPNDGLLAFTDLWWKLVRHAAAEGKRLGIDVGLHNCPGYTSTSGPWVTPELSMQEIFQSQTVVEGGSVFRSVLPKPVVDPRGNVLFPMINKQTGALEKPIIAVMKGPSLSHVRNPGSAGRRRSKPSASPASTPSTLPPPKPQDATIWSLPTTGCSKNPGDIQPI